MIEKLQRNGEDVYETTQLVNSCLGLLVFPQQEFMDRIPETPLDQLARQGWPIPRVVGNFKQVTDLNQLIRYLRNAISHFNVQFIGDGHNEIRLLKVWNTNPRNGEKTWQAELSVSDLRKIAHMFSELLIEFRDPNKASEATSGSAPGAPPEAPQD